MWTCFWKCSCEFYLNRAQHISSHDVSTSGVLDINFNITYQSDIKQRQKAPGWEMMLGPRDLLIFSCLHPMENFEQFPNLWIWKPPVGQNFCKDEPKYQKREYKPLRSPEFFTGYPQKRRGNREQSSTFNQRLLPGDLQFKDSFKTLIWIH